MKKLTLALAGFAALLVSTVSFTQDSNNIQKFDTPCSDRAFVDNVTAKFEEVPMLRGNSSRKIGDGEDDYVSNPTVLYINPKTMTYSLVEKTGENTYCFISVGADVTLINSQNGDTKPRKGRAM